MKAVGLTNGGFYAHFPDKTAMLVAAVERAFVDSPKRFAFLATKANETGDTGLIAKHYLSDARVENIASGCPAAALMSELHRQDATVQAAFQVGSEDTMRALSQAPGLSSAAGHAGWAALSMLVGGLSLMRAVPDTKTRTEIRDQIISALRKIAMDNSQNTAQEGSAS
jgi:TetR/AcrR family transcriptional regulator, transcriptional repressor for nem operon